MAEPSGTEVQDVTIIPCGASHDFEAYAAMKFDGGAYPGDDAVQTQSQDFCGTEFATFVGKAFDDSTLEITYLYPTRDSWKGGDREIMCLIGGAAGAKTTGTLKGTGL
ncbi:septum formation family protein [Arthrobacter sp. CJ23]|uniref:septum formation family protein n=1 Tax=Arthrobacter sp. CJ23 TaxID=2972479 RepID=UPI00215BF5F1|nr:septum formation family protein [Arthrobacter sp. CJ23]UVJ40309.1 septum formation family protein [Arthrobacter sp. CJ23]